MERQGIERQVMVRNENTWKIMACQGKARHFKDGHGLSRNILSRKVKTCQGKEWLVKANGNDRHRMSRQGMEMIDIACQGKAWHGMSMKGKA
jgi:hypothetical protein